MAISYKILGQASPLANTVTTLHTAAYSEICSNLLVCNRGDVTSSFRVSVRPSSEALEKKHYIVYDPQILSNDSLFLTISLTLSATDIVEVYSSSNNLSFILLGSEMQ